MSYSSKRRKSSGVEGFLGGFFVVLLITALIFGIWLLSAAIFQWFWNDFVVTHTTDVFTRADLWVCFLPTWIISMFTTPVVTAIKQKK